MISGIIMASGLSKRMGQCKLLMKYEGKPLIQWVMEAVKESSLSPKLVVTGDSKIKSLAEEVGLSVIDNEKGYLGQSESVKLGILNSKKAEGYAFIPGDQPFITDKTLNQLIHAFEMGKDKIIVPTHNGIKGSPVIFHKKYNKELLQLQGDMGGRVVLNKYKEYIDYVHIDDRRFFMDIDTKDEYKKLVCEKNNF